MIKRFPCTKDTSITNAYKSNLMVRGTDANLGASDILEVFSIYGRESSSSLEAMRTLIEFDIPEIVSQRTAGSIPASGSVSFYLRLFNAPHQETTPSDFSVAVRPLSQSFDEGYGLDMEGFTDTSLSGTLGATWAYASSASAWSTPGGDFTGDIKEYTFDSGFEDLSLDITSFVEEWITGSIANNGLCVLLSGSLESSAQSYYTKKFFGRGSHHLMRRPVIEARWDSSLQDRRSGFIVSSSRLSSADNLNTLFFYNYVRGELKDLPGISTGNEIYVYLYTSSSAGTELTGTAPNYPVTGGWHSTGVYTASFALDTTASLFYDRWEVGGVRYYTGEVSPNGLLYSNNKQFVSAIRNMKSSYSHQDGDVEFDVFIREKNWSPNIYSISSAQSQHFPVEKSYYKVFRFVDDLEIVPYGTGSIEFTKLSIGPDSNYFNLDMNMFEPGYLYGIKLLYKINNDYLEQPEVFKFRVE